MGSKPWSRGHRPPHGGAAKYKLAAAKGYFRIHDCCEFFKLFSYLLL